MDFLEVARFMLGSGQDVSTENGENRLVCQSGEVAVQVWLECVAEGIKFVALDGNVLTQPRIAPHGVAASFDRAGALLDCKMVEYRCPVRGEIKAPYMLVDNRKLTHSDLKMHRGNWVIYLEGESFSYTLKREALADFAETRKRWHR